MCWEGRRLKRPVGSQATPSVVQAPCSHPHLTLKTCPYWKYTPGQGREEFSRLWSWFKWREAEGTKYPPTETLYQTYSKEDSWPEKNQLARPHEQLSCRECVTVTIAFILNIHSCKILCYHSLQDDRKTWSPKVVRTHFLLHPKADPRNGGQSSTPCHSTCLG